MKMKQSKNILGAKIFWSLLVAVSLLSSSYLFVQNSKFPQSDFVSIRTEQVAAEDIDVSDYYQSRDFSIYKNVIGFIRQLLY